MEITEYSEIPAIMTRKELQKILRISKTTAIKLLHTGMIESFAIGNSYRITKDALIQFIENSTLCSM